MTSAKSCAREASLNGLGPLATLTVGLVLCLLVLIWSGWQHYVTYVDSKTTARVDLKIQELRGTITYLDEVLTMSARMAAATGNPSWEDRHRQFAPVLRAAIADAIKLAAGRYEAQAAARTDLANDKLDAMENQAFALIRQGRQEQARELIFSQEYEAQKKIYAQGMVELGDSLSQAVEVNLQHRQRQIIVHAAVVAGLIPFTLIGYLLVCRATVRNSRAMTENNRRLAEQAQVLTDMNRDLDQTVAARSMELARANEALLLRLAAIESATDMIVITNRAGVIEYVNPAFVRCTGYTAQEAVGRPISILKSGRQDAAFYANLWNTIVRGQVWRGELVNRRKDGSFYDDETTITPVRDPSGAVIRFVAINRDITERKRRDRSLCITQHSVDSAPYAVAWAASNSRFLYVNDAACRLLGYSRTELLAMKVPDIDPRFQGDAFQEQWQKIKIHGSVTMESEARRKDGATFPVELVMSHLNFEDQDYQCVVVRDLTARKRAAEIEQQRHSLQAAIGAMERVMGVVGHELRTPLAGMRAMAEMLITDQLEQADKDTFLKEIHDQTISMAELVNNLLETSRLNSGMVKWNWSEAHLATVCEEAIHVMRPLIDAGKVRLTTSVEPAELSMLGDPEALRRLLINFISNAAKNTADGSIHVQVRPTSDAAGTWVRIEVQDTGNGISPRVADKLGEAFALSSGVIGSDYVKGAGLGLAICRGIAAAHGGNIFVASEVGKGTTFTIRLRADLEGPVSGQADPIIVGEMAA